MLLWVNWPRDMAVSAIVDVRMGTVGDCCLMGEWELESMKMEMKIDFAVSEEFERMKREEGRGRGS